MNANQAAFLAMIRASEIKEPPPDIYRATFQGELSPGVKKPMYIIRDLSYHPAELRPDGTREWDGESLAFLGPEYEHKVSTAAGAYQMIRPTWLTCKKILKLPDFTPSSQDDAALLLIRQVGAMHLVSSGAVADAITLCNQLWASLPGSSAKQPTTSFADLIRAYGNAGGGFA